MNLDALLKESTAVTALNYSLLVQKSVELLEKEKGRIGNLLVDGRLVTLQPIGEAVVVGDLHGDLQSLKLILQRSGITAKLQQSKDATLIFLGDYGDRGPNSAEIYYVILTLKLAFPNQVIMLRGNHEAPGCLLGSPHDLPRQFQQRFGSDWEDAYMQTTALWDYLYNAVYVPERYLMVHGGVSDAVSSLKDIAAAQDDTSVVLEDLLWSDPSDGLQGVAASPRGAGKLFGKDVAARVLERVNAKVLIRGHEPSSVGYKISHNGKVLTLFSRRGAPYFNQAGAYLQVSLFQRIESANELTPNLERFYQEVCLSRNVDSSSGNMDEEN